MNNIPNNQNGGRQIPPGDPRRREQDRATRPPVPQNGSPQTRRPAGDPQRRPQNGIPPRRPIPPRRKPDRLGKLVIVWVAVLAVLLAVILIIAFSGREEGEPADILPVAATTDTRETEATTEPPETYPVKYADVNGSTTTFPADLDFANGILIDLESNTVVASRGGDKRIYPASMTKIMTLIVAVENAKSLDDTFTMTAEITDPLYIANASVAGFLVGEEVTVRDLIYGLMLPSGGDGALGLAYHIAGSEEAFAELMNKKAAELGLKNTHFTNCTGLHGDDHYSTCHEIALILEYAIQDDFMREVLSTYQYTTAVTPEHPEGILLTSTLLSRMNGDESETMFVQGGKTGYTIEAKNCLATFATDLIPGMDEDALKAQPTKYILVTAGSPEKWGPVFDAIEIYKSLGGGDESADGTVSAVSAGVAEPDDPAENVDDGGDIPPAESGSIRIYTARDPE